MNNSVCYHKDKTLCGFYIPEYPIPDNSIPLFQCLECLQYTVGATMWYHENLFDFNGYYTLSMFPEEQ